MLFDGMKIENLVCEKNSLRIKGTEWRLLSILQTTDMQVFGCCLTMI